MSSPRRRPRVGASWLRRATDVHMRSSPTARLPIPRGPASAPSRGRRGPPTVGAHRSDVVTPRAWGLADELHRPPGRSGGGPRGERGSRMTPAARLRVGVLGLSHDHVWANLRSVVEGELGALTAVAEPDALLRARLGREYGGVAVLATYEALLERTDLDAVLLFADNRASSEWGVRALVRAARDGGKDHGGGRRRRRPCRRGARRRRQLMVNGPRCGGRPGTARAIRRRRYRRAVQLAIARPRAAPRSAARQFCAGLRRRAHGGGALVALLRLGGILAGRIGRPARSPRWPRT